MADKAVGPGGFTVKTTSRGEVITKLLLLLGLVYLFILSISLLGESFKLFGKDFTETIFQATSNPIVGLMLGILSTAVIQSSSTTTCIIVGMVANGSLAFESSIAMIMGANIGTSVTNTIVSMGHISRGDEFRRAFAGAMCHDFFNVCSVIALLPLQLEFNLIGRSARFAEALFADFGGLTFSSPLKTITEPVAQQIVTLAGHSGWLTIIISFFLLFVALRYIVKVLKSMVLARVEKFFQRYIFRTPVLSLLLGVFLTAIVQSSSITTSMVVPLIGAGVISIQQIYPYLLGANIGTTITAFLASFVTGSHEAVTVAFGHLLFNVYGMAIFWPLKRIPIWMAEGLARIATISRLYPILYVLFAFYILPAFIIYLYN